MRGLIAKKIGMTRVVADSGEMVAVTLLEVVDQKITKILTPERDGYHGIQVGYFEKKAHRLSKADITRLRKVSVEENYSRNREFRLNAPEEGMEIGHKLDVASLGSVTSLDVTGLTKGHGFEGAITRWGHKTGRRTHGSHFHRRPGSLGQRTTPGRVYKNKEMPGHMGAAQRTVQNLKVVDIDTDKNVIAIRGSVPGHRDGYVLVQPSVKAKQA